MKIRFFMLAGAFFAIMLLAGCATKSSNFKIPLPTVKLKANSKIKITTHGNASMLATLEKNTQNFFTQNNCKITDNNPDYWVAIYGTQASRIDNAADNAHNIIYKKVRREHATGGEEIVVSSKFTTATNAHFASIVVYEVKTMTPLINFDFPFYSSSSNQNGLRSAQNVSSSFNSTIDEIIRFNSK